MSDEKDRSSPPAEAIPAASRDHKEKDKERGKSPSPAPPAEAKPQATQTPPPPPPPAPVIPEVQMLSPTAIVDAMERRINDIKGGRVDHLVDSIDLEQVEDSDAVKGAYLQRKPLVFQPILIVIEALRANAKVFISIRDGQRAIWSESDGKGLVGFSISTSRDPTLYMRSFLINSREMYIQSYRDCQEIQLQLYVQTAQAEFRGCVELPPGTSVTLQTGIDRTSLIGLSSFTIEFPSVG